MKLAVLFLNIGGYHAARLRALQEVCDENGWKLTAIQVTDSSSEHQWGSLDDAIDFDLRTLLPVKQKTFDVDGGKAAFAAARTLRNLLNQLRPEIIAIPGWGFPISRATLWWSKRNGAITILMSESKRDDEKRWWWKETIKSWFLVRRFDAALVGGRLHYDYLVELGLLREKIFLGYDVVDNDYFRDRAAAAREDVFATHQRNASLPRRPFFLAVTRLIDRKNVVRLVEAFAVYRQHFKHEAWDLAICGSGKEELNIKKTVQRLKLVDAVHMPGFVSYEQIGDWYGLANAFVHAALHEQWGLVLNEACAAGLPILSSQTVGARYDLVKENENGWTFDPQNQEDITGALIRMHTTPLNERERMGKTSQTIVADFSPHRFATGMMRAVEAAQAAKNHLATSVATKQSANTW